MSEYLTRQSRLLSLPLVHMNIYGDVVMDEMAEAHSKVVGLALNGAQAERKVS